jgi:galactokinase
MVAAQYPQIQARIGRLEEQFTEIFGQRPEALVRSPGRAEILGNHTDYNLGLALSCCIDKVILAAFAKNDAAQIRVASTLDGSAPVKFDLANLVPIKQPVWSNYVAAVISELVRDGVVNSGIDILIESDLSTAGGVSSSAALELAIAFGWCEIAGVESNAYRLAELSQRAENGPFVRTPCGLLDQTAIAVGKAGWITLMDFGQLKSPFGQVDYSFVKGAIHEAGLSLIIVKDIAVKRRLGETGYSMRRLDCESSVAPLALLLGRALDSLSDVDLEEFLTVRSDLERLVGNTVTRRALHIVGENSRVKRAVETLKNSDFNSFGRLLTESGVSALENFELDEGTPELASLLKILRNRSGVLGARNMGGGFSALTLALIEDKAVEELKDEISRKYTSLYHRDLTFIPFVPVDGTVILK